MSIKQLRHNAQYKSTKRISNCSCSECMTPCDLDNECTPGDFHNWKEYGLCLACSERDYREYLADAHAAANAVGFCGGR
jgi:hypothetical protein